MGLKGEEKIVVNEAHPPESASIFPELPDIEKLDELLYFLGNEIMHWQGYEYQNPETFYFPFLGIPSSVNT